jgi:AcrR family transcriptional regulator
LQEYYRTMTILPKSVREQAKDRRRAQIIGAARELITQRGGQWTMLELADRAGVSPMTPYNLLGSKQAIILELVKEANQGFADRVLAVPCSSALDRLFRVVTETRELNVDNPRYNTHLLNLYYESGEPEVRRQMVAMRNNLLRKLVQAVKDEGFVRPEIDVDGILGTLGHIYAEALVEFSIGTNGIAQFEAECLYGFALVLAGAAAPSAEKAITARVRSYQAELARLRTAQPDGRTSAGGASRRLAEPIHTMGGAGDKPGVRRRAARLTGSRSRAERGR